MNIWTVYDYKKYNNQVISHRNKNDGIFKTNNREMPDSYNLKRLNIRWNVYLKPTNTLTSGLFLIQHLHYLS